ncbi:MAG: ATP-binding cassette domain-containing protein [Candidatus Moranbacteria bacterium]|jgi:cell division transport system ATP-binding protein|nr:ATP-binding cassette domain-containing protein [Candidatus Moranbacteria bacterium]MDD5652134.1 ATP-binding cassette domain-containing protein [Candidatus Moranbacteria bacterium]MDX9855702.1 ATP-binding cassette domain-containing protein [Candidatus Moranbacteria bacterium]
MPAIVFRNVEKSYEGKLGTFTALKDVNLVINPGEFVCIVGKSGAGKTTMTRLIYANETPTKGDVYFGKRKTSDIKRKHLPFFRRNFGTVFQDFKLLPQKTVFENVSYAMELIGRKSEDIENEVPKILEIVGLKGKEDKYPSQLSGGEKQKVSLARAIINNPDVIVADEPTGNLDPVTSWDIVRLLVKINELGTTVVLATHDKTVVDKLRKRVVTLDGGRIVNDEEQGKYIV